jgi:HlyD family secretion protein
MAVTEKRWIGSVIGAAVLVLVLVGLAGRSQAPEVDTVLVARQNLEASITSNGKVEPIEPYVVRAEFATFVEKVSAVEGQAVHRGQVILTLDANDTRAQLARAREQLLAAQEDLRAARAGGPPDEVAQLEADLRKAQVDVASLSSTQEALKKLAAKQAATQDELDQNEAKLARAQAQLQALEQKKAALAQRAQLDIERAGLRAQQAADLARSLEEKLRTAVVAAPVDGTLYSLPVRAGDYVKVGDVLAEMADLHRVRVRAFVDEPDLGWLAPDQFVEITWDAMPDHVWTGRTEQIPKQVVARGTRSVGEVLCSVDNQKLDLLPNVNVNVRIRVRQKAEALVVPRATVRSEGTHRYVFLVQGSRLRRREITLGINSATMYEIVSGLAEGDRVALPGELELKDGMEVRALEPK